MLTGGDPKDFRNFAYRKFGTGDVEAALRLHRAAVALDSSPDSALDLAVALASAGRCDQAAGALVHEAIAEWRVAVDP